MTTSNLHDMSVAELDKFYTQEVIRYRALFKAANVEPQ